MTKSAVPHTPHSKPLAICLSILLEIPPAFADDFRRSYLQILTKGQFTWYNGVGIVTGAMDDMTTAAWVSVSPHPTGGTPNKPTRKEERDIISIAQFNKRIPDEAAAIAFMEKQLWGDAPICGRCGSENVYRTKSGKPMSHRCRPCKRHFSVRTGTVMAETNLPVRTWLLAIHFILTGRKGMSALQLHKMLGVAYSTSWFLCHRIREAMKAGDAIMTGIVEVDETYIGGKMKSIHKSKKPTDPMANKFAVIGAKTRDGRVIALPISNTQAQTLQNFILHRVKAGSVVYTDGHPAYSVLSAHGYNHEWVEHSSGEYVRGMVTTNGIESFWALLKRGYIGTFHYMSWDHLHRYCNEFAYRDSVGPGNGFRTIGKVIDRMAGERLTYERLIAKVIME